MNEFTYRDGSLAVGKVSVSELAGKYGTPLYVYSADHFRSQYRALAKAMAGVRPLICYSVKANSNATVIRTFVDEGAGLDIVSGGELFRSLRAGGDPRKIVFAGVGKTVEEIEYALRENILFFTAESEAEVMRISECARRMKRTARVAFRVNPDVDSATHKYVNTGRKETKFGLDIERTIKASMWAGSLPGIEIAGVHMHIGSQILSVQPFVHATEKLKSICSHLKARFRTFKYVDIGGGIGIRYRADQPELTPAAYAQALLPVLRSLDLSVVMEPGRYLVGNGAVLVCRVQYVKENSSKKFIIADAGMNDLIRPSLYDAHHEIVPVVQNSRSIHGDLVGPVCESGDFIAKDRNLPEVKEGDLLAVESVGAYGYVMASNYNSRPRPAEVMVDGDTVFLARERETWEDLVAGEHVSGRKSVTKRKK
jgi:diaminopimelate decarboxylase